MPHDLPPDEHSDGTFTPHPDYKDLDDGVKAVVSAKQFAWMPDSARVRFMSSIGEPDTFPDA